LSRLASAAASIGVDRAASMLSLLADVAGEAAKAERIEVALPRVLELVRTAFGASECTLWSPSGNGIPAVWRAGDQNDAAPVLLDLERDGRGIATATVRYGSRDIGVLSVKLGRPLESDERVALRSVADTLAPMLANAPAESTPRSVERIEEQDRQFLRKIVDSLPIGLYVIDREYRIQAWNRKRETGMQGVSREEALGRTVFEILHRQSVATLKAEFDEVFSTGRMTQTEVETLSGGEQRTYRLSKIPMRLDDGAVTHVITIGEDITESRRAQERLAQSEKLAAIGQLAAGVMHEINNPLATIGVCVDNIARRVESLEPDAESRAAIDEYLSLVWSEVERCKNIAMQLLAFSRPRPVSRATVDVHELLETTLFLLKHHERFRGTQVLLDPEPGTRLITKANGESLIQAFMALMLNASDAMSNAGRLTISTRARPNAGELLVQFADEGTGISRADLPRVFEPFFTTKEPGRGTGLGLSICYGIVTDHGGRIEVESELGKGAIFRVFLPMEERA
jgi:two-component system NtrC family sensor kinase